MKNVILNLVITCSLFLLEDQLFAQGPVLRQVYLKVDSIKSGERFNFKITTNTKTVTLDFSFSSQAFAGAFNCTETINVTQTGGPRSVYLENGGQIPAGTTNKIYVINAGTGSVNPKVGIRINKPPLGKSFTYRVYKKRNNQELSSMSITAPDNIGYFPGPFNPGDTVYLFFVPQNQMVSSLGSRPTFVIPNKDTLIDVSMGFMAAISINRLATNEKFKFELRHTGQPKDTLEVSMGNVGGAYFRKNRFYEGDTLYVRQLSGPRVCNLPAYTIMTNTNTFISAGCGSPGQGDSIQHRIGIRIPDLEPGGFYRFSVPTMGGSEGVYVNNKDSIFYFSTTFYNGDTVPVTQYYGPRTVTLSPLPAVVGNSDLILTGYFGTPPPPPAKTKLAGTYSGPPGSRIVIKSRYNEELTITADANGSKRFRFPKEYSEGELYSITIKTPPPNCNCIIVPYAEGAMPVDSTQLSIICNKGPELVSRSTDDKITNTFYESTSPVVGGVGSDEGRYVAFVSSGAGIDGSLGKYRQIYLRDMKTGTTKLISRASDGSEGNNNSFAPAISADGKTVAFESYATNLASGDNNGVRDVYLWKEGAGVSWVSQGGNAESYEPRINGNGSSIVFSSSSSTLAGGVDGTSTVNVYLSEGGSARLLTKDPKTGKGVGGSAPDVSEDGNRVVFCSYSDKLVSDDKNGLWDIFLWSKASTELRRVSKTSERGEREQGDESASRIVQASISGDGKFAAFATTSPNMVSGDNNKVQDVFVTDLNTGRVMRVSLNNNAEEGNGDSPIEQGGRIGITYDGRWVTFQTNASNLGVAKGNIVMKSIVSGETRPVTNSIYNTSGRPLISRYGAYIVAGCSEKMDGRFTSSGIFRIFTGSAGATN